MREVAVVKFCSLPVDITVKRRVGATPKGMGKRKRAKQTGSSLEREKFFVGLRRRVGGHLSAASVSVSTTHTIATTKAFDKSIMHRDPTPLQTAVSATPLLLVAVTADRPSARYPYTLAIPFPYSTVITVTSTVIELMTIFAEALETELV